MEYYCSLYLILLIKLMYDEGLLHQCPRTCLGAQRRWELLFYERGPGVSFVEVRLYKRIEGRGFLENMSGTVYIY